MERRRIGVIVFAIVAISSGAAATQFDLVTDSTMLIALAIGMIAMGIDAYQQRTFAD